jgi:hypothetical protein
MKSSHGVSFYVDLMIVECLLSDERFVKNAQGSSIVSELTSAVKTYVGNTLKKDDITGSLLDILAPGAISVILGALGFKWLGLLVGLAMRVFHVDVRSMWKSIHDKIKDLLGSGNQVSSSQIDNAVQSAVQEHTQPATQQEADEAAKILGVTSSEQLLQQARMLKLAMIEYEAMAKRGQLSKQAQLSSFLSMFSLRKANTTSLLGKVIGLIFKIAIASAGLMVAGDVVNKLLDRPNALDGSYQKGKPVGESAVSAPPAPTTTQTKFKVKSSYKDTIKNSSSVDWVESVRNDKSSIEQMVVDFAKEVYDGLDKLDSVIRGTAGFQAIVDKIVFHNQSSAGNSLVFIPKIFASKKRLVDYFIDDVAENAP